MPTAPPVLANISRALAALALVLCWNSASAERADRDKPINVEADAMRYDDLKQVNVFTGRVTLTKGSLVIRADRLTLRQDPEGYPHGMAEGVPARFRQKRDSVDEFIDGEGRVIAYDGRAETVRLEQRASLRRLAGERVTEEVHGRTIVYDSRTEFIDVAGGAGATGPENPNGRVRVIIQPRNAVPETPAPAVLTPERALDGMRR